LKKIIVKLTSDGLIHIEAEGYQGNSCEEATRFLQQLGTVTGDEKKPEYYEEPLVEVEYDEN
jgi:hypothetical protein